MIETERKKEIEYGCDTSAYLKRVRMKDFQKLRELWWRIQDSNGSIMKFLISDIFVPGLLIAWMILFVFTGIFLNILIS